MLPILIPPTPRIKHIDFAEARRIDEIDAGRSAIELDRDGDAGAAVAGYQRFYTSATLRCTPMSSVLTCRRVWRVARNS